AQPHSGGIYPHHALVLLETDLEERLGAFHAGVVHQDVDAASALQNALHHGANARFAGDIDAHGVCLQPFRLQALGRFLCRLGSKVSDDDVDAAPSDGACRGFADASCTAGDDRDLLFGAHNPRQTLALDGWKRTDQCSLVATTLVPLGPMPVICTMTSSSFAPS